MVRRSAVRIGWALAPVLLTSVLADDVRLNVVEHTLGNGMKFLIVERRQAPVFAAYWTVKVGSVDEQTGRTGAAHLLEHMMAKGTKTIGAKDLAREREIMAEIDKLADQLHAQIDRGEAAGAKRIESLRGSLSALTEDFGAALDILADMLRNPKFSQSRIRRRKKILLEDIRRRSDSPASIIDIRGGDGLGAAAPVERP